MRLAYLYLTIAIVAEVVGTSALKSAEGFTRLGPSVVVVIGYGLAFYFLSRVLGVIPIGIAYAVWAGLGIVLIALVGVFFFGQSLDAPAVVGMLLIVAGVVIMNAFSRTVGHQ